MTINEELKNLSGNDKLLKWKELIRECGNTQEKILGEILSEAKDTEIGVRFSFDKINTVEEFQKSVPLSEYSDYECYIERMEKLEENILFKGCTDIFLSTSGTTGKSKRIPENTISSCAKNNVVKIKSAINIELIKKHKRFPEWQKHEGIDPLNMSDEEFLARNRFFSNAGSPVNKKTDGGIKIGYASGYTLKNAGVTNNLAYPLMLQSLSDLEAVNYLTMLFALRCDDVIMITGNNAARFKHRVEYAKNNAESIINDLRYGTISNKINLSEDEREEVEKLLKPLPERADELQKFLNRGRENFIPKYYWPYIMMCCFWLSGSLGLYANDLYELVPYDTIFMDVGFGASEGKFNVPYKEGAKDGTLSVNSAFFEFLDTETNIIYTADKVTAGKEYELIVTTFGGLYRYNMHDIVRVNGFNLDTPDIEFITKTGEILNVAGEKIAAVTVAEMLKDFAHEKGIFLKGVQIYPCMEELKYIIYIETSDKINNVEEFEKEFDKKLCEGHEFYGRVRKFGFLNGLNIIEMKKGWIEKLYSEKIKNCVNPFQIKPTFLINKKIEGI